MSERLFTPDLFFGVRQPTFRVPIHVDPEGTYVSLTVQTRGRGERLTDHGRFTSDGVSGEMVASRVVVVDAAGHTKQPFGEATSWGGVWSPDGRRLAAYAQDDGPAYLAIWDRVADHCRMFRDVRVRPYFGFEVPRWSPDARKVIVKVHASSTVASEPSPAEADAVPAVRVYAFDPDSQNSDDVRPSWADGFHCDLVAVDVEHGDTTTLVRDWVLTGWEVSPSGDRVAALRYVDVAEESQQFFMDLSMIPLDGSPPSVLATHVTQRIGTGFSWSPDGGTIACTSSPRGQPTRLYVVAADGNGETRDLTHPTQEMHLTVHLPPRWSADSRVISALASHGQWEMSVDGGVQRQIELDLDWDVVHWVQPSGNQMMWHPSTDTTWYVVRNPATKNHGIARVRNADGESELLFDLPKSVGKHLHGIEVAPDGSRVYLLLEAADHPAELWRVDGATPQKLLTLNPELNGVVFGKSKLIEYRGFEGQSLRAAVVLPPGYRDGERLPTVIDVYGGSIGSDRLHRFDGGEGVLHPQLLAARGYAVVYPDIPLTDRDPLRQLPGLVLPAVDELVRLGIADPARIAVMSNSYGGYCALGLLVQTSVFRAAVVNAGFSNLISTYLSMDRAGNARWLGWAETGQARTGGTPWEAQDAYIENSPLFALDRVQTPLLLTRGTEDRVPAAESEAVFVGLRRLGRAVELREYEGEGHWPGRWTEDAYRDLHDHVLSWLDRWLSHPYPTDTQAAGGRPNG